MLPILPIHGDAAKKGGGRKKRPRVLPSVVSAAKKKKQQQQRKASQPVPPSSSAAASLPLGGDGPSNNGGGDGKGAATEAMTSAINSAGANSQSSSAGAAAAANPTVAQAAKTSPDTVAVDSKTTKPKPPTSTQSTKVVPKVAPKKKRVVKRSIVPTKSIRRQGGSAAVMNKSTAPSVATAPTKEAGVDDDNDGTEQLMARLSSPPSPQQQVGRQSPATSTSGDGGENNVDRGATDSTQHQEEDPLILAAEAAAALMDTTDVNYEDGNNDNQQHNLLMDDIPMELLGVIATVEPTTVATSDNAEDDGGGNKQQQQSQQRELNEGQRVEEGGGLQQQQNLASVTQRAAQSTSYAEGPVSALGPVSTVRTFHSTVPPDLEMSATQRDFVEQYYNQEDANRMNNGSIVAGGGREEEEEIVTEEEVDEEGGEQEVVTKSRPRDELRSVDDEKENVTSPSEGGGDEAGVSAGDVEPGRMSLKQLCKKLKRSTNAMGKMGSPRNAKRKGVAFTKKEQEDEDLIASGGDGNDGSAAKDAAAPATNDNNNTEAPDATAQVDAEVGPQVEVVNGQIRIAESSLLPNPTTRAPTSQIDEEFGNDTVVEDETNQLGTIQATYSSYATKPITVPKRWSAAETRKFYSALRQAGTDFGLMSSIMANGRTREQLKRKYKVELRKNPNLMDMALDYRCKVRLDMSIFGDSITESDLTSIDVMPVGQVVPAASKEQRNALGKRVGDPDSVDDGGVKQSGERDYDSLFKNEEGRGGDDAEHAALNQSPSIPAVSDAAQTNATKESVTTTEEVSTTALSTKKSTNEKPATSSATTIPPLAPASGKARKTKKARFKAVVKNKGKKSVVKKK